MKAVNFWWWTILIHSAFRVAFGRIWLLFPPEWKISSWGGNVYQFGRDNHKKSIM